MRAMYVYEQIYIVFLSKFQSIVVYFVIKTIFVGLTVILRGCGLLHLNFILNSNLNLFRKGFIQYLLNPSS